MEFKGTQGEWKVVNETQICFANDGFSNKDCDLYEHQYASFEELIANAKLLAASKDLLKALQGLLKISETLHHPSIEFANGNAINAINKALN